MKISEGVSVPSRTNLIWAGKICGQCEAPLGDDPVIRVQGVCLGLSYLGTDKWGGRTICPSCNGGRAPILRPCEHCKRPTGFLTELGHRRFFCSDRCRCRDDAQRRKRGEQSIE